METIMTDVLFILDKWCHGSSKNGISAWESNFVNSYRSVFPEKKIHEFNFDLYNAENDTDVTANEALQELINEVKPRYIFLVIYEMPQQNNKIISVDLLVYIKSINIPIVTIFGDLEHKLQCDILTFIEPFCTLIYYTALTAPGVRIGNDKLRYAWVPKDPHFFNTGEEDRPRALNVSYLGTPKRDRMSMVRYLNRKHLPVFSTGGERRANIGVSEYTDILRNSKISLSFSRADGNHVTNARTFEIISCGALLLEQEGMETPKLFRPYVDYVPFFTKKDLLQKCDFYLSHEQERRDIVASASKRYDDYFSAYRFWSETESFINQGSDQGFGLEVSKASDTLVEEYWALPLVGRHLPKYHADNYRDFPAFTKLRYKLWAIVGASEFLSRLDKIWYKLTQLPFRIVYKIYLTFKV